MSLTSCKKIETNKVELQIAVNEEQFQKAVNQAYKKNVGKIALPGFRKGKAPKAMIEKMYGKDFFYEDAVNIVYPQAYEEAVAEGNLEPVDRADVSDLHFAEGQGFTFKAVVTVKPEVEIANYKGIKVEKNIETIMAADVNAELDRMRERNARLISVEGRAAKLNDTAIINFEGFVDGVAFEGGKGENHPLLLGSGQFIPGFEDQIVGKKIGEEFDVNVTFPEEYHAENLAGKAAVFKVTINALQTKELPDLDDEFVKDVSEFDTVAELKKDVKERLQKAKDEAARQEAEGAMIDVLIENMKAEIPQVIVENKTDDLFNDFAYRLQSQGLGLDMYLQYTGMEPNAFRDSFKASAERQVKVRLALEKIAELEKVQVSEEEMDAEFKRLTEVYGIEEARIKNLIPAKDVKKDLEVNKAIDIVRENADIKEKKIKKTAAKSKKAEAEEAGEENK